LVEGVFDISISLILFECVEPWLILPRLRGN
jgi:hypothetical protein